MDLTQLRDSWAKQIETCTKADLWGQLVEANEGYEALCNRIRNSVSQMYLEEAEFQLLQNLVIVLEARSAILSNPENTKTYPAKEDMRSLLKVLDGRNKDSNKYTNFPIDLKKIDLPESFQPLEKRTKEELASENKQGGILASKPAGGNGEYYVTMFFERIGLKDAERYVNPVIWISVYDKAGNMMELKQETPIAESQDRYYVNFNTKIHLQTPLKTLLKEDAAIFFEFVHYKENYRYHSTRCWSLLEMDEFTNPISSGDDRAISIDDEGRFKDLLLEIYKKPMDKTRKKIKLHSVKKLYSHIKVKVHK